MTVKTRWVLRFCLLLASGAAAGAIAYAAWSHAARQDAAADKDAYCLAVRARLHAVTLQYDPRVQPTPAERLARVEELYLAAHFCLGDARWRTVEPALSEAMRHLLAAREDPSENQQADEQLAKAVELFRNRSGR